MADPPMPPRSARLPPVPKPPTSATFNFQPATPLLTIVVPPADVVIPSTPPVLGRGTRIVKLSVPSYQLKYISSGVPRTFVAGKHKASDDLEDLVVDMASTTLEEPPSLRTHTKPPTECLLELYREDDPLKLVKAARLDPLGKSATPMNKLPCTKDRLLRLSRFRPARGSFNSGQFI